MVPLDAIVASSISRSWNFSSPIAPPKNPVRLVKPGTIGARNRACALLLLVRTVIGRDFTPRIAPLLTAILLSPSLLRVMKARDIMFSIHKFVEVDNSNF